MKFEERRKIIYSNIKRIFKMYDLENIFNSIQN